MVWHSIFLIFLEFLFGNCEPYYSIRRWWSNVYLQQVGCVVQRNSRKIKKIPCHANYNTKSQKN